MGKARAQAVVLDAGALIAFERGDARMRAIVREALKTGARLVIPAAVLGQVWRGTAREAPVRALVKGPTTAVIALDHVLAEGVEDTRVHVARDPLLQKFPRVKPRVASSSVQG